MYVFSCSIAQQDVDPLFKNLYNSIDWWNNETSLTLITPQGWQSNVISRSVCEQNNSGLRKRTSTNMVGMCRL